LAEQLTPNANRNPNLTPVGTWIPILCRLIHPRRNQQGSKEKPLTLVVYDPIYRVATVDSELRSQAVPKKQNY